MSLCPCGSSKAYIDCCQSYHAGTPAPTAELLMRSRYSAFYFAGKKSGLVSYLIDTHHASKRASDDREVLQQTMARTHWLRLEVVETQQGQADDKDGTVEFIATFEEAGQLGQLHERSEFIKQDSRWFYLDGEISPSELKLGRNELCPCGSGKKFKKCHG